MKLKIYFLILLFAIVSPNIDIYLYCIGTCTVKTGTDVVINLNEENPPFDGYPNVYTATINGFEPTLKLKVEDFFFSGITGHITVDGYSFYIGISDLFQIPSPSADMKKIQFYEKNIPRILQYSYINVGLNSSSIEIIFNTPTGNQLYEAQFPSFDNYCKSKIYYTNPGTDIDIDFTHVFVASILQRMSITFPPDFTGTVDGNTPSTIDIDPTNPKMSISLGGNEYVTITTTGSLLNSQCTGYVIISSLEEGCESYDSDNQKCQNCFDNYVLLQNGTCIIEKEGQYILKDEYRYCYRSCKNCQYGGNTDVHNCLECNSIHHLMYHPDYRVNSNFCYEDCSSVGLIEKLAFGVPNYCSVGCRINFGDLNYDDKLCLPQQLSLPLGLFMLHDEGRFVKECPDNYPYIQLNGNSTVSCLKKCKDSFVVYIKNNKKYCTQNCLGLNYVGEDNVCGVYNEGNIYYEVGLIKTTNCKTVDPNNLYNVNYGNQQNCGFGVPKANEYEYYDGLIREYYINCPSNYQNPIPETKKCSFYNCVKFYNGTCVEICDAQESRYYYDYLTRECLFNCDAYSYYVIEDENNPNSFGCVKNNCPLDYPYLKIDDKQCVKDCGNLHIENNKCVANCLDYIDLDTNKCVSDKGTKIEVEGTRKGIIHKCDSIGYSLYINSDNKSTCVEFCPSDAPFVDQLKKKCVSECPPSLPLFNQRNQQIKECTASCYFSNNNKIYSKQCLASCLLEDLKNINPDFFWGFDQTILDCENSCTGPTAYCMKNQITNIINEEDINDLKEPEEPPIENNSKDFLTAFNNFIKNATFNPSFSKDEIKFDNFTLQRFPIDEPYELTEDTTRLSLNECATILKNTYDLDDLYIFKGDIYRPESGINQVEYVICDSDGDIIDLSPCEGISISIQYKLKESEVLNLTRLASMMKDGIDILNTSSSFYTDVCLPYSSSNKTDVVLSDRRDEYYPNISLCDIGCEYGGVDIESMIINCDCDVKTEVNAEVVPPANPKSFDSVVKQTNLWLFKCYKVFLNLKNWNNYGFYFVGLLEILSILIFFIIICTFREQKIRMAKIMTKNCYPLKKKEEESISTRQYFCSDENKTINQKKKKEEEEEEEDDSNKDTDYDEIPYHVAIKEDKRSIIKMMFDIFTNKIDFIQMFCFSKWYDFILIKISSYIFMVVLGFTSNAFLYSDDVISNTHHNGGELGFWTRFGLSTLANILTNIITNVLLNFIKYQQVLELFEEEIMEENKKIMVIKKYFSHLKVKFAFYFFFKLILSGICFYFVIIFCTVYRNSQLNWLKDCCTGLLTDVLISFTMSLFVTILRFISLKCRKERIYYFAMYSNKFNCIISL